MLDLLPLLLIFGVVYFVMIRPQQKRQQQTAQMLANLSIDDDVITIGGMYGTVVDLDDESVDLRVSGGGMVLRFQKGAIARVVADDFEDSDLEGHESADSEDSADDTAASATDPAPTTPTIADAIDPSPAPSPAPQPAPRTDGPEDRL